MNKSILVSVITPCFNSEKTIERTLQCIQNQTYQNIEYIIIDGGSTDRTLDIIRQFQESALPNLILVSEKDQGIYDAMNKGIKIAKGKLIGIVNSDDYYQDNTVELAVSHCMQDNNYQVIYGMQRSLIGEKEKTVFIHHHEFLKEQMITHPTCFVTKKTYDDLGVFNLQYRSSADYDLMLRFWESGKVVFTPIYEVMSNFQMGGMSGSQLGVRETAKIKRKRGYISHRRYLFLIIKSILYEKSRK